MTENIRLILLGTKGLIDLPDSKQKTDQDKEVEKLGDKYHHWRHSSLLIEVEGRRILIDVGKDWTDKWQDLKPDAIAISHTHPDHFDGIKDKGTDVPVHLHPRSLREDARLIWHAERFPNAKVSARAFEFGPLQFTPIPVTHSVKFPAVAWWIKFGRTNLLYSPDYVNFGEWENILKRMDYWIVDGTSLYKPLIRKREFDGKEEFYGHNSIKNSLEMSQKYRIANVILTHMGHHGYSWDEFEKRVKEIRGDVTVGRDGMEIMVKPAGAGLNYSHMKKALSVFPNSQILKIVDIASYDPSKAENKPLGDDLRIVFAWWATLKDPRKKIRFSKNEIIEVVTKIIREIAKRVKEGKMKHTFQPDQMKPTSKELFNLVLNKLPDDERRSIEETMIAKQLTTNGGRPLIPERIAAEADWALYLQQPHAEMVWKDEKKAVLKSIKFHKHLGEPVLLGDKKFFYGIYKIHPPKEIDLTEFRKLQHLHAVSDEEAVNWGWLTKEKDKLTKPLFFYLIEVVKKYPKPLPRTGKLKWKEGEQTWFQVVSKTLDEIEKAFKGMEDVTKLPDNTLLSYLTVLKGFWKRIDEGLKVKSWSKEDVWNAYKLITAELDKRKVEHIEIPGLEEMKVEAKTEKSAENLNNFEQFSKAFEKSGYSRIYPSTDGQREEVTMEEVLPFIQGNMKLREPLIYLTGSIVNNRKGLDIDILIKLPPNFDPGLKIPIAFRIYRLFPHKYWPKLHLVWDMTMAGPFTNNVPLYSLTLERINSGNKILEMSLQKDTKPAETDMEKVLDLDGEGLELSEENLGLGAADRLEKKLCGAKQI